MAWIVPIASAVIGAAGSYLSSKKNQKAANQLKGQQQPLIDLQTQNAKTLQPYVGGFFDRSQQAFDPALNYYKSLLSGNRGDLTSALAPEIEGVNRSYDNATQTARELSPRGGATTSLLGNIPYAKAGAVQSLISSGRAGAANSLAGMAQEAAGIGGTAAGYGNNAANSALSANQNTFNNQQYVNGQNAQMYGQIAAALGSLGKYDANNKTWSWAWSG